MSDHGIMKSSAKPKAPQKTLPPEERVPSIAGRKAGRPKIEDLEKRTEELLAVAEAALVELGYEGATLNLIAERASVSKQTIYAKYGGKPGLLRAVLARIADGAMGAGFADADDLSLEDGLFERARTLLTIQRLPASRAITAISIREGQRFPEFIAEMMASERVRQRDPIARYLKSFQSRGLLRDDVDCDKAAATFIWLLAEDSVREITRGEQSLPSRKQIDERARFAAQLMAGGLSGR